MYSIIVAFETTVERFISQSSEKSILATTSESREEKASSTSSRQCAQYVFGPRFFHTKNAMKASYFIKYIYVLLSIQIVSSAYTNYNQYGNRGQQNGRRTGQFGGPAGGGPTIRYGYN